jgi:hypothetical protein
MLSTELKNFIRSGGYAWPGGYPCFLLMADGEVIDAKAARERYREVLGALRRGDTRSDCYSVGVEVHWEGAPLVCAHSGREIPSAYGDPAADA